MPQEIIEYIGTAIKEGFPKAKIFAEEIKQGFDYKVPCIFINLESSSETLFLGSRYFSENRFCISYFPIISKNKNEECERAAEKLFDLLKWIKGDSPEELFMGRKMSFEIKEGRLFFYVNYDFYIYKTEEIPTMENLSVKYDRKGTENEQDSKAG